MQINQLLAASVTMPSGTSNTVKETGNSSAKSDFMKLVEQLIGGSDCDNSMLPREGTLLDSNTYESNTCGNPMVLIKDNNGKQKGTSKTDGNQQQALSPQLMQEIALMQTLTLQAAANPLPQVIVNQNPTDELPNAVSTQPIAASNSLENATHQGQSATELSQNILNSDILQVAQLIVNMQQVSNDASTDSNATMLDAKTLKVLNLFTQAAQKLIKANTDTVEQPMPTQKTETDKIRTKKIENLVNAKEQQAAALSVIASPLQIAAQTMQNTDITNNNNQTDTMQVTSIMKTNVNDIGALDAGQAEYNVSNKDKKTNSQTISTSELQTSMNEFSDSNDLKRLFSELNVTNIQSNIFNGQKTDTQQANMLQKNSVLTAQPMITTSTQATQELQTTQALLFIKALCEKAHTEVNTILQVAQANIQGDSQHVDATDILNLLKSTNLQTEPTLEKQDNAVHANAVQGNAVQANIQQEVISKSITLQNKIEQDISRLAFNLNSALQTDITKQVSPTVGSITPFQLKIIDKNTVVELKTDKKSEVLQNGKPQDVLNLTQDEAFKQVLVTADKNQGNAAKSNNQDTGANIQVKAANDMNVNGIGNVQTFSVSTIEGADHSQAQSIVRQTSNAVATAVSTNRSDFKVHLSPEDLGGITIKMVSKNGTISIQIIADNPHTGQILSGSIGDLNTAIGQHGITVGKSEILHTGSNSSFSAGDFSGQRQQTGQQQSQPKTQQYKQSESSLSWKPVMQIEKEQANRVMPQVLARSYDIMA
jgi:hypothetical protein